MHNEPKPLILIHGLLRTKYSLWFLGQSLKKFGFKPYLFGYRSRKGTIDSHAKSLRDFIIKNDLSSTPLYFVNHSLGSIVLRQFAAKYASDFKLVRAVDLGPPHQGSSTAKTLSKFKIIRSFLGPSFMELTSLEAPGVSPKIEHGVIAGQIKLRSGYYGTMKGENDGVVSVEETHLAGQKDHITVPATHSLLMYKRSVIKLVLNFLEHGNFGNI